jgi:hypothetical protein
MPATAGKAHSSSRDYLLSWIDVGRIHYATSVAGEAFDKLAVGDEVEITRWKHLGL